MQIMVETFVSAPLADVWDAWVTPEDIKGWNAASDDWHTTEAEVDLQEGGRFRSRMEAKDGSMGFDFEGTYKAIIPQSRIEYMLEDGRRVTVQFDLTRKGVQVQEVVEAENEHSAEMQQQGWQAILDNFKAYVEAKVG